jgi:hypothetical protein
MSGLAPEIARLTELAVERMLGELSAEEAQEYDRLRARHPEFDAFELERAAAALHLASGVRPEPIPARLRSQLAADATDFFGAAWRTGYLREGQAPKKANRRLDGAWLAAAACLLLAVAVWIVRPTRVILQNGAVAQLPRPPAPAVPATTVPATIVPATVVPPTVVPATVATAEPAAVAAATDPAAQRAALLASGAHLLQRAWRAGTDPAGLMVSGDIVWDPATQTGYMRFVGLRRNEPNAEQYQLWIFDARRDERYPIDGGVFDISGAKDGDVIPIRAKLSVGVPLLFAVTIERPGGVVVSDRTRIAALADTI